jgi:hypothetical protein
MIDFVVSINDFHVYHFIPLANYYIALYPTDKPQLSTVLMEDGKTPKTAQLVAVFGVAFKSQLPRFASVS